MEVIFLKDLKNQGKKGQIKNIKDGYASFLITKKIVVQKTDKSLKELEKNNHKEKQKDEELKQQAKQTKKELEKNKYVFKVKTGEFDKVFGSVSTKQIKQEIDKIHEIDKNQIKTKTSLNALGFHDVEIELYKDIKANIKIELVK